ncbi:MAG: hypothetical protein QM820_64970 [Minicystis sp.]
MPDLSSHPNVYETCLRVLADRGWRASLSPRDVDEDDIWRATKGDVELWADNPIELLGLVGVWEARWPGEYVPWWWTRGNTGPSLWEQARDEADAENQARIDKLEALRRDDPAAWEARIRCVVTEYGDLRNAASILEIPRSALRRLVDEDPRLADLRGAPDDPRGLRR